MGEFQCYKFKTIDCPLSSSARQEVEGLSSRGEVTSNSATFIYHYSDFRHDAKKVLLKYFDAMLYFSNWGTRRLMFRLPAELVDAEAIAKYAYESQSTNDHLSIKQQGAYVPIEYLRDDDNGGDWMEATDYDLGDLSQVRNDILQKNT